MAAAILTVWLLWGSTFLGIRVVVLSAPPLLSAGARFFLAGAILLGSIACWRRATGQPAVRVALAGQVRWLSVLGMLHFLVANGLVSVASLDLPSSTAAVLFATVPLWALLSAGAARRRRPANADLALAAVGLLGVVIVLGYQRASLVPALLVLAAAATWAGASVLGARGPRPGAADGSRGGAGLESSVQMLAGGLGLVVAAGLAGEWGSFDPGEVSPEAWLAEAYLILFGSLAGFLAYNWLLVSQVDPLLTSTFSYVNPLVAVVLGALVLDEQLGPRVLLGAALIAGSVALTVRASARTPRPALDSATSPGAVPALTTHAIDPRSNPCLSPPPTRTCASRSARS